MVLEHFATLNMKDPLDQNCCEKLAVWLAKPTFCECLLTLKNVLQLLAKIFHFVSQ